MEIQLAKSGQAGSWKNNHARTSGAGSVEHQLPPLHVVQAPYWWRATRGFSALAGPHLVFHRTLDFYLSKALMRPRA